MPDQTARDAVAGVIFKATFTAEWDDCQDGYQETRAMILRDADAILATLGIPPDTTTSEISAGLRFLAHAGSVDVSQRQGGTWVARDRDRYSIRGVGASPAAAIHALAAKLAEAQR